MSADHLAAESDRLKNDPIFNKALDDIRAEALNWLAAINANDTTAILRHQQRVAVIDEIRTTLDRYILLAEVQENSGSFA